MGPVEDHVMRLMIMLEDTEFRQAFANDLRETSKKHDLTIPSDAAPVFLDRLENPYFGSAVMHSIMSEMLADTGNACIPMTAHAGCPKLPEDFRRWLEENRDQLLLDPRSLNLTRGIDDTPT